MKGIKRGTKRCSHQAVGGAFRVFEDNGCILHFKSRLTGAWRLKAVLGVNYGVIPFATCKVISRRQADSLQFRERVEASTSTNSGKFHLLSWKPFHFYQQLKLQYIYFHGSFHQLIHLLPWKLPPTSTGGNIFPFTSIAAPAKFHVTKYISMKASTDFHGSRYTSMESSTNFNESFHGRRSQIWKSISSEVHGRSLWKLKKVDESRWKLLEDSVVFGS